MNYNILVTWQKPPDLVISVWNSTKYWLLLMTHTQKNTWNDKWNYQKNHVLFILSWYGSAAFHYSIVFFHNCFVISVLLCYIVSKGLPLDVFRSNCWLMWFAATMCCQVGSVPISRQHLIWCEYSYRRSLDFMLAYSFWKKDETRKKKNIFRKHVQSDVMLFH